MASCFGSRDERLLMAVGMNNLELVKILLLQNMPVNATNYEGRTPLSVACEHGNTAIVRILLEHGANPTLCDCDNDTALHRSIGTGDFPNIVELLVRHGALLDLKNNKSMTALHYGCDFGRINSVRILLNNGADHSIVDGYKQTPLFYAACSKSPATVKIINLLIDNGAETELRNTKNLSPYDLACQNSTAVQNVLAQRGVNTSSCDIYGNTSLHHAVVNDDVGVVDRLLKKKFIINAQNKLKDTPFHKAVKCQNRKVAKFLMTKGCKCNTQDITGDTPIHSAIEHNDNVTLKLLLNHGSSVNIANLKGFNALHYAAYKGNEMCANI